MRRLLLLVGAVALGGWLSVPNWRASVPDDIPESATLSLAFDRIEGDVDAAVLPQWLAAASADIRLGYQAKRLLWPFTAELKAVWSSHLPIFTLELAPRTFWRPVQADEVQVSGLALSWHVREVWAGFLHLKEVDLGADLPSLGMGLPPQPWRLRLQVRPWLVDDALRSSNEASSAFAVRHAMFVVHGVLQAQGTYAVADWLREPALSHADGTPYRAPGLPHPQAWTLLALDRSDFTDALAENPDGMGRVIHERAVHRAWLAEQEEVRQGKREACPCDVDRYPPAEIARMEQAMQAAARVFQSSRDLRPYRVPLSSGMGHVVTAKRKGQVLQVATMQVRQDLTAGTPEAEPSAALACQDTTSGDFLFVDRRLVGFRGEVVSCAQRLDLASFVILWDEQGRLAAYTALCASCAGLLKQPDNPVHQPDMAVVARVRAAAKQAEAGLATALPDPSGPW